MKSVMKHAFSMVPRAEIQRSVFDRSCGYKTTFDSGYLIPFFVDEVLPGDTFKLDHSILARLSTPIVPIMDNVFLETFFFFVPNRLVWENWQRFCGERDNPEDSIDFLVPQLTAPEGGFSNQSIFDYMGLPTKIGGYKFNSLALRAYNLIYNEWFRDENLQDSVTVVKGDSDDLSYYTLLRRGKRHDYFTSCLPWPQKGEPVEVPLAGSITADTLGSNIDLTSSTVDMRWAGGSTLDPRTLAITAAPNQQIYMQAGAAGGLGKGTIIDSDHKHQIDQTALNAIAANLNISGGSPESVINVNDLRTAFQVQRMLEKEARSGSRYTEILRGFFGVISPDGRLQRPEYLGGSSTRINVTPVAQTASTDNTSPQGNLAAFGYTADSKHVFNHSFTEHGIIIGLLNVRADLTYQQGLERHWSRQTRYDYYWPTLAHLGEQAVLNKEIYAQGPSALDSDGNVEDEKVFGYQERYAEYRYKNSQITGKLRSNDSASLDVWHLSQYFENLPVLNSEFIVDNPPIARALAVQNEPQFIADCYFNCKCVRPMPVYSVPGLIDHF